MRKQALSRAPLCDFLGRARFVYNTRCGLTQNKNSLVDLAPIDTFSLVQNNKELFGLHNQLQNIPISMYKLQQQKQLPRKPKQNLLLILIPKKMFPSITFVDIHIVRYLNLNYHFYYVKNVKNI